MFKFFSLSFIFLAAMTLQLFGGTTWVNTGSSQKALSQYLEKDSTLTYKNAFTVGVLQGGGALIGFDYERLVADYFGIQVGAGFIGFGACVNYHLKPTVNSSAISLAYWNQGLLGDNLSQRIIGSTFILRTQIGFTGQIGLGLVLDRGKVLNELYKKMGINPPPVVLLYSIGWYFKS